VQDGSALLVVAAQMLRVPLHRGAQSPACEDDARDAHAERTEPSGDARDGGGERHVHGRASA